MLKLGAIIKELLAPVLRLGKGFGRLVSRLARGFVRGLRRFFSLFRYLNPFWWLRKIPWMPRLSIIDRQIFRGFFVTFVTASFLFICILTLFDLMNQVKFFLQAKSPVEMVVEMYFYKAFFQFTMISPAAALFAVIYTINKMARNNELIAVINAGMSIYRMTISLAIFGVAFSAFLIWFNDVAVFPAERRANQISDLIRMGGTTVSKSVGDVKLWGEQGVFWKANYYDYHKAELRKVLLLKLRSEAGEKTSAELSLNDLVNRAVSVKTLTIKSNQRDKPELILNTIHDINDIPYLEDIRTITPARYWLFRVEAEFATYEPEREGWVFKNGRIRYYDLAQERVVEFEERFFPLSEKPYDFERSDTRVNGMTTGEARAHVQKLEKLGAAHRKELVEYYLKFSFPLINAIIVIIGISFGGFSPRSVLVLSFFVAVLIYLLYYTFVAVGLSLGKTGDLPPIFGAWMGNLAFLALGAVLLVKRKT